MVKRIGESMRRKAWIIGSRRYGSHFAYGLRYVSPGVQASHTNLRPAFASPLRLDPRVHALLEHVQRHRARSEHHIVELADVEALAHRFFSLVAQLADSQLADLVGARLSRPGDVAIDLGVDVQLAQRG